MESGKPTEMQGPLGKELETKMKRHSGEFLANQMNLDACYELISKLFSDASFDGMLGDYLHERITRDFCGKDAEKATRLREEGNKTYAGNELNRALELYNKSILHSPLDSPSYVKALANRSAVFMGKKYFAR